MEIIVITSFPELFPGPLSYSLVGKALKRNLWSLKIINIRDYGIGKHKKIDDTMYGGGPGLILRPDVLERAIEENNLDKTHIYYPSPRGKVFSQKYAMEISKKQKISFLCGRFEGVDERVIRHYNAEEISIGDYVLSNGELACFVILDSVIRLLPGVIGNNLSLENDSFSLNYEGKELLEYPLYTRPAKWKDNIVPSVLLSGNDKKISEWKKNESIKITKKFRPELFEK
ncbi:MAG: tRNA (guanosine(37)-N1)-methyltransferase TrmD [Rickettsia sp.]|nr:tRNA (guanosine(37)-N1)-methyltransferase TrmD [Rickettsia sp.]